jgi:hypothetical protein
VTEGDDYGYTEDALAQYERLRVELADPLWFALNALFQLIFDEPAKARERSEPLRGPQHVSVWKLDAVAGDAKLTVIWTLTDDPAIVWVGTWPPM